MIRFSKILFTNPAKIWLSGIECSYDNLIKIANIFECKWIALTIDSLPKKSRLLKFVKEQGLDYIVKQHSTNYMEASVVVPYNLFNYVLEIAICEDPENIFIFNLLDPTNWNEQLQRPYEELVATGYTDVFISISLNENALLISVNKSLLQSREVYKKIRALRFE